MEKAKESRAYDLLMGRDVWEEKELDEKEQSRGEAGSLGTNAISSSNNLVSTQVCQ